MSKNGLLVFAGCAAMALLVWTAIVTDDHTMMDQPTPVIILYAIGVTATICVVACGLGMGLFFRWHRRNWYWNNDDRI